MKYYVYSFFRHLPEKIDDDIQLKNMSGQWFYEAKSKRHKDKIHGTDIIRASLRRKPATIGKFIWGVLVETCSTLCLGRCFLENIGIVEWFLYLMELVLIIQSSY